MASDITVDKDHTAKAKTDSLVDKIDSYQDLEVRKVVTR